jgi:DNA mismatch endonuclease Vsr
LRKPIKPGAERSALMARVRQRDTSAERAVGAILRDLGLAYRKNVRALAGAPDFANRKRRWAVFVQGCFWHRHTGCPKATVPEANREFWIAKFLQNRRRDAASVRKLRMQGFRVILVWECQLQNAPGKLSTIGR